MHQEQKKAPAHIHTSTLNMYDFSSLLGANRYTAVNLVNGITVNGLGEVSMDISHAVVNQIT